MKALEAARAASGRARALVADLSAAAERHLAAGKRVSLTRAGDIASALKANKVPKFETVAEIPTIESARLEAESRLVAAKQALEELSRDESAAEAALAAAEANVTGAIKSVVLAEAEAIADEIETLESEAADLHEKLGIRTYFVGQFLAPFGTELARTSPSVARVMAQPIWETNGKPMKRCFAHMERWKAWAAALAEDADAQLKLD